MYNVLNHPRIKRNDESNSVSVKEVIVHRKNNARKVIMILTKYIYAYVVQMSDNCKSPSRDFGFISHLTNWILDSGETYNMTPHVLDFIPGSLEDMDKHIEVTDGHHVTAK